MNEMKFAAARRCFTHQLTFGAFTVWTQKEVLITTAHVATGALILGTSLLLVLRTRKLFVTPPLAHRVGTVGEAAHEMR